jgi:predicted glutamine amidotransferase
VCELLAVSSSQSALLTFSLRRLAARGGRADLAHDGWGVAFYQGSDVALFKEPAAAAGSGLVQFLEQHGPSTNLALSHIRHATWGAVQYANTQPFTRELGGYAHVFAHNGYLTGIESSSALAQGAEPPAYRPIGQTDSELAFCALLARMRRLWDASGVPALPARMALLTNFAADLRRLGAANFLYADGETLFAHGHKRATRLNGPLEAPGLWILQRRQTPAHADPAHITGVVAEHGAASAVLIASVPLTNEAWQPMQECELIAVQDGRVVATHL